MSPRDPGHNPLCNPWSDSKQQIRLLTLLPASNHDDDLSCRLQVVDLQDVPKSRYEALSYPWGDPSPKFTITINGPPFEIWQNLCLALRYLRDQSEPRTFRIDAVCKDQSDPKRERSPDSTDGFSLFQCIKVTGLALRIGR